MMQIIVGEIWNVSNYGVHLKVQIKIYKDFYAISRYLRQGLWDAIT